MKTKPVLIGVAVASMLIVPFASNVFAVEGGLARPISGAAITPYAGLVPPLPGFAVAVGEAFYSGTISGGTTVPIGNNLTLGVDMTASFTPVSLLYIWPTIGKEWNFASAVAFPLAYVKAEAVVTLGRFSGKVTDDTFGLFDLAVTPIVASYHISQTDHVAFSLTIWAPTGRYDPNRLANLSLNNWTFIPGVAYTKIFPKAEIELSGIWALNFYTENPATHYQNGIESDLEFLGMKRFKNGAGIGTIFSWLNQISDDGGATADRLNGFSGHAFGIGPIITYSTKVGKHHLDLNARFIHEFESAKRVEGDLFQFSATLKF